MSRSVALFSNGSLSQAPPACQCNGIRAQCQNKYGQTKKGAQIRGCCPCVRDQLFPLTFSQFGILTLEIGSSSASLSRSPVVTTIHSRASARLRRRPFTLEEPMIRQEDHFRGGHLRTASRCPIIKPPAPASRTAIMLK